MSDAIKHECGIVLIRLLKPLDYYQQRYGTSTYALNKLYLLMEKQHNRGQEAAGVACVKLGIPPGNEYIFRERAMGSGAIDDIFGKIYRSIERARNENQTWIPYNGEIYLGHLRYSTTGRTGISYTHPFLRRNNWQSRNLCLAGNFNLTNVNEIFDYIVREGQHPRHNADTFIILEQMGNLLDIEVEKLREKFIAEGYEGQTLNDMIDSNVNLEKIIRTSSERWDGGFVITGATGGGNSFIFRDRWGIRPAFYYMDDEIVVAASERAVIQTVMNVEYDDVNELGAGAGIIINSKGDVRMTQIIEPLNPRPCSFERIYFSRGSDRDIYRERKELGRRLTPQILKAVNHDLDHTVFSFIPNTAEVAYYGMLEGMNNYLDKAKAEMLLGLQDKNPAKIDQILNHRIRTEKLAIKDIKLRTFIAEGSTRNDLAAHVYDITYGTITPDEDSIVIIDDSIVRGTTLKQSVIRILSRLKPLKIVIVSSSPQVRFPDCYGIDMSSMGEFIAFNAAIELLKERGMQSVIDDVYAKCKALQGKPKEEAVNYVKEIYAPFTYEEVSKKIASMVTPTGCKCEIEVVYQTIENLHASCPAHNGDWYFSGDYPTAGGNALVAKAFVNYYEGNKDR